jgi:3-(3-hydroxy-phenyl)propionate hydroxylase
MPDAPVGDTWLISLVQGEFTLVGFGGVHLPEVPGIRRIGVAPDGAGPIPAMATGPVLRWVATGWVRPICSAPTGTWRRCFRAPTASGVAAARDRALGHRQALEDAV